jgi:hypothetical protein
MTEQALVNAHVHRLETTNLFVAVLVKQSRTVLESPEDLKVDDTENTADEWRDPVDLVMRWKTASLAGGGDRGAKDACGIDATAGPGDKKEVNGKDGETDADRGEVGSAVLFDSCRENRARRFST